MSLELTLEQLGGYIGEGDSSVYFAVKGVVYDVTPAKNLYGPGRGRGTCRGGCGRWQEGWFGAGEGVMLGYVVLRCRLLCCHVPTKDTGGGLVYCGCGFFWWQGWCSLFW